MDRFIVREIELTRHEKKYLKSNMDRFIDFSAKTNDF